MLMAGSLFLGQAQEIEFQEYDLGNGMHVILHQDKTAPVVITSVMYHVGAKDENPNRTGFAHFFEHLLFEGTKNIQRGDWFKIVSSHGGTNNANTTNDRTYYYEVFPSNNLELGLWMESERMLHPVIDQIGVDTQNEVVKEEKRQRYDTPYGKVLEVVLENLFENHPYRWTTIGSMDHLDAAQLSEFKEFNKKWYTPQNATLVVAGDIDIEDTKNKIEAYFAGIPANGLVLNHNYPKEQPITKTGHAVHYDPNTQLPMYLNVWRTPSMKERDAYVLDMISTLLSDGKSSRLYKKMVDEDKVALQVFAQNLGLEDYGVYFIGALPLGDNTKETLNKEISAQIKTLQTELISDEEFEKLQNIMENRYVNSNSSIEGIAGSLATYHVLYGNTNLINTEIDIYRSITKEEIREVAKKYLNDNQKVEIDYLPESSKPESK